MESILNIVTDYLLQQSWQIAVLFVLVAAGCWLLRKASAHWRYLLWSVVLAKCLMPPMATLSLPILPEQTSGLVEDVVLLLKSTESEAAAVAEPFVAEEYLPTNNKADTTKVSTTKQSSVPKSLTLKEWVGLGWIAVASLYLTVMLVKGLRLQKYLKLQRHELNESLEGEIKTLQDRLRLNRLPSIWEIDGFGQPFVWGLLRGSIYLPRDFGETVAEEHRQSTLVHEIAHVSRWDAAINTLQIVVQAIFFFHPLVWWANKKIRQEREKCCDEVAIAQLDAVPKEYGSAILENLIMENKSRQTVPTLAIAGPVKNIEERIMTIMKPNRKFFQKPTWMAIITALLLAALTGPTALVLTVQAEEKAAETDLQAQDESAAVSQGKEKTAPVEKVVGQRPRGNCSISGKVVSAENGEPVENARMYLFYIETHGSIFINTASDGTFLFKDIPKGPFSLMLSRTTGYQDVSYNPEGKPGQLAWFSLEEDEHRSGIVLKGKRAYRISGKILNENGKIPKNIDTLNVLAWTEKSDGKGHKNEQARVNKKNGTYSIDGLGGEPVYVMAINWRAAKQGNAYPPIYYQGTFSRNDAKLITFDEEQHIENIDITLKKEGGLVLEGTVTDETGKPIPEAFVVVHRRDMLFDFVTAYTDEQGKYQIQGLGDGEFLVHVDAVHRGFVRTRIPIDLDRESKRTLQDFTLSQGVMISGKFVDEEGNDWQIGRSHGQAHIIKDQQEPSSMFSLTDFRNKHRPKDVTHGSGGGFSPGEGDYEVGQMLFPTKSTFVIQGVMSGNTMIIFYPKKEGQEVVKILQDDRNIMPFGLETKSGQKIEDVTIVIGTP